jgi:hypothetical protein
MLSKKINGSGLLCYECAMYHPKEDMQDEDCAKCGGRKCKRLYGGQSLYTCRLCKEVNLCIDCHCFGLICNGCKSKLVTDDKCNTLDKYVVFINMWSPDRIIDNMYWKIVGKALCNIGDQGLSIWIGVIKSALLTSTKDSFLRKYNSTELVDICTRLYKFFVPGRIDAKSLVELARIDNPVRYDKWHIEWVKESLILKDLESAFYRIYWLNYVCDDSVWYQYKENRLTRVTSESLKLIGKEFIELCKHIYPEISLTSIDTENLFNEQFLKKVSEKFYIPHLNEYIDDDPELTLLADGKVIVANKSEIFIRQGMLQDYLVKSFGVSYNSKLSWDHPNVKEFMDWCFMMWINKDVIHRMLKFGASLLYGDGPNNKIFIWLGSSGNNMKTTYEHAISKMCGNKCMFGPIGHYIDKSENEEYGHDVKGIRILFSEESADAPSSSGRIKSEVGGDPRMNRRIGEDPQIIKPQHKCVMVCNVIPSFCQEPPINARTIQTSFESQAVYDAPFDREEQIKERKFPRDPHYHRKLPIICESMLWAFFNYYQHYIDEGL